MGHLNRHHRHAGRGGLQVGYNGCRGIHRLLRAGMDHLTGLTTGIVVMFVRMLIPVLARSMRTISDLSVRVCTLQPQVHPRRRGKQGIGAQQDAGDDGA